jgi:hypothetical protein
MLDKLKLTGKEVGWVREEGEGAGLFSFKSQVVPLVKTKGVPDAGK